MTLVSVNPSVIFALKNRSDAQDDDVLRLYSANRFSEGGSTKSSEVR